MYHLPDKLWAWAWTAEFLALAEEKRSEGGIILPQSTAVDSGPAFAHFSTMLEGTERSWLWFFPQVQQAASLRILPASQKAAFGGCDNNCDLIEATLPEAAPGEISPLTLVLVDQNWLARLPLEELGIHEIWIGFHWRRYLSDRNLRFCADTVLSAEEFCAVGRR